MPTVPDSPELQEFYEEEAKKLAAAAAKKAGKPTKREIIKKQKAEGVKALTPEEALQIAQAQNFKIVKGKGKHPTHIVNSKTGQEFPMPVHGGGQTLSKGLVNAFLEFVGLRSKSPVK